MAQLVVMPQLGNTVESCLITTWLVKVGDVVEAATLLCEIETDKSAMEVPSGVAGTVLALLAEEGDEVPVKQPIVVIGAPGETAEEALAAAGLPPVTTGEAGEVSNPEPTPAAAPVEPVTAKTAALASLETSPGGAAVSPRARGLAASQGIAADRLAGSGPTGRVIERDVEAAVAAGPGLTVGARVDAEGFVPGAAGGGIGGRVTRADLAAAQTPARPVETAAALVSTGSIGGSGFTGDSDEFPGGFADTALKGVRKVIAERMMNSLATSAQLTYTATAPAAGLMALRKRLKGAKDPGLSTVTVGDLVGYAAVKTLVKHPIVNSHLADATLRTFERVHLGMAVDTPRGLLVPTLRFADTLSLRQFAAMSKQLANEAIGGSISPDLLGGATFTVSNLGAFGIESFTPLLNVPQVAILGVDAIFTRAVINPDGSVGAQQRIGLSLTADHRVIDGADAARYLKDLAAAIADIDLTVLG